MLSFRRYLSDYHARRWIDYEKILMMRTMCSTFSRILLSASAVTFGTENWHLTQEYIDKGGLPNEELAIEMFPYAKTANQVWLIARVVLFIACLKWPKLIKLYFYFECVLEALVAMLPSEINMTRDVTYSSAII